MGTIVITILTIAMLQSEVQSKDCKDDEKIDCVMLTTMFNICNVNIENAAKLCPHTCNLCYYPNGNWVEWSSWSACSVTCGNTSLTRSRTCTNPPPESHGKDCEGSSEDKKQCVLGPCPVDGNWTDWSTWSACAITCGNTTQTRSRTCTNPPAAHNGTDCEGTSDDYQQCLLEPCPVDGNWTDWSSWSACSVTCGSATQSRIRTCTNPPPSHNGTECEGASEDYKSCVHKPCRGWGQWSAWGSCSSTSGVGIQHRNRSCYTPFFTSIDDLCIGDYTDVQICMSSAFADGGWTTWSSWSTCSVTCGIGLNQRTRSCTNPEPSAFCHHCEGPNIDVAICNNQHCPTTAGEWSKWSSWRNRYTCTEGEIISRFRECNELKSSPYEPICIGHSADNRVCVPEVRLTGGLLEIYVNGQWGTVCDDEFDSNDAKVACRMLGFDITQTAAIRTDLVKGQGSTPIWLDDLRCNGNEDSLLECSHNRVGSHNCDHNEDVGLVC